MMAVGGVTGGAPSRRLGAYELIAPLATGGMAELFVAKTTGVSGFEKQVALKVIHPNYSSDPEFVRMLVDEAKLAVQLQHANIVQTYDLGQVQGRYYIAMELIDGADLYKILRTSSERGLDFPIDVAAYITSEVATGLDYAHRKNDPMGRALQIVHRDVSPQNVLVSREGEVKIVDFGIAKAALRNQNTEAGVIKGKYFYMSPEQSMGEKIDARTDVFSTGILLHEMLVGEMLYLEDDFEKLLQLVRAANIQPPSRKRHDVPPELDAIVMKALAKRPVDRYQSAADLSTALTRFLRTRQYDAGRSRVTRFVRDVLESEPSRVDIAIPPARREDFDDEASIIQRLSELERSVLPESFRRADDSTRGVPSTPSDYEEAGATEFDANPISRSAGSALPSVRDFANLGDDADQTEAARRRPAPPPVEEEFSELEKTRMRPSLARKAAAAAAASKNTPTGERPRKPSLPPIGSPRMGVLPPVASPARAPRPPMELGVNRAQVDPALMPTALDERALPAPLVPARPPPGLGFASAGQPTLESTEPPDWSGKVTVGPVAANLDSGSALHPPITGQPSKVWIGIGVVLACVMVALAFVLLWPDNATRGVAEIVSFPPGATVRMDGNVLSKTTPLRINDLDATQPHHLSVSLRGFDTWESDVKFKASERNVRLQAVLVSATGTLDVSTTPPGAEAIVNGRMAGLTPTKVNDLPPNEDVTLELRLRGYRAVYVTLQWNGKRALTVSMPLEKAL